MSKPSLRTIIKRRIRERTKERVSIAAKVSVACNVDRDMFGITGPRRIRIKKMKRLYRLAEYWNLCDELGL